MGEYILPTGVCVCVCVVERWCFAFERYALVEVKGASCGVFESEPRQDVTESEREKRGRAEGQRACPSVTDLSTAVASAGRVTGADRKRSAPTPPTASSLR